MSSSFVWTVGSIALSLITPTIADGSGSRYQLIEAWQGEKFLDHFNVFSGADPTNGFVTYTNQSYAESSGLIKVTESGSFYMGVDYETELSPNGPGRESVRIESKEYYDEGLYIIDLQHMPGSACGTWPAFWSVGPNWPYDGEIDIIEGVNKHEANKIVLHTSGSCALSNENDMTGTMTSNECGEASGTVGCVVEGKTGTSGTPFNEKKGGVYAMEWTSSFVKIWYFARSEIPKSITEGNPDTTAFGAPMAHLQGTCDFGARFKSQKFILDTTFCGDWAGGVFGDSGCPVSDPSNPIQSCVNYVAQNPAAFKEAYWEINYIKLFQTGTGHATASVVSQAETATAVASKTIDSVSSVTSTTAPAPETASAEAPATSSAVPEPANPQTSVAGAETTAAPAPSAQTTAAPANPSSDDSDEGADAVSETTIYVTETTTICGATTQKGSIQTLSAGETDVSPASSTVESAAPPAAATPTAQEPVASQPGTTVNGGTPVPTDVSPETPAEETAGESSAPTPSAQQPEQSPPSATNIEPGTVPPAASTAAPTEEGSPEGASPVGATESRQAPEPAPTSVAPIRSPSHSSWTIHSSSRVASSSSFASTTASASRTTSATQEATAPTETNAGASTGTNPESPVFTAGASKSVGISGMAGIVCGVFMAMLA
ncbi:hypothetical protein APSETT444_008991 [Aspergillus pseudonomiae]